MKKSDFKILPIKNQADKTYEMSFSAVGSTEAPQEGQFDI